MATATDRASDMDVRSGLKILSLDAGGPQAVSQLWILDHVMNRISEDDQGSPQAAVKRPCEVFDVIGGVGTGGLIAIFLVVFQMTAKEALEKFIEFAVEVYQNADQDPKKQTEKLKRALYGIPEKYDVDKDMKLIMEDKPMPTCRLVIPISYKNNVNVTCVLRNYTIRQEPPTNLTIAEAMLATSTSIPMFTPISIGKDFSTFEYISGDLGLSNPVREVIAESHHAFGDEATVACLLSIGCGHPGVNFVPDNSDAASRAEFFERVAINSEKVAQEIAIQMNQLTAYYRLSVNQGLEPLESRAWRDPETVAVHTSVYLNDLEASKVVEGCVDKIKTGHGSATLEQLRHSGGATILPPPLPPLTQNYVERKVPMDFIVNVLFDQNGRVKSGSKRIVVTGIGGCGKTQLVRRFIEQHRDHFVSTFVVDGSDREALRRDLVRHVRSINAAHSQDSFDDAMSFLSQSIPDGQRLLIIDNVDDPSFDLAPFLPRWETGVIIVTSRNVSRGQLSPSAHLQLDVMSLDESVELLVRGSGREWPPSGPDREAAVEVAKELGCHPIALTQAISYMASTGYSTETYITRLQGYRELLLKDPATNQLDMRYMTAFAAFDASYDILSSGAQKTLNLLSLCHRQKFPLELIILAAEDAFSTEEFNYMPHGDEFERGRGYLKEVFFSSGEWSLHELDSVIMSLRNQSLITVVPTMNFTLLEMHSLAHEWSRLRVPKELCERVRPAAVRLLCCGAGKDNYRMMQYLVNHVVVLSSPCGDLSVNDAASCAFILGESGLYAGAARLQEYACDVVKSRFGADHLSTISPSVDLALTYRRMGRYADAEVLDIEVLRRRKEQLGIDHPHTIDAAANLAVNYGELGRYTDAEALESDVLRQRKEQLGIDHPDTISASANLAITCRRLGRYADAEALELEVLRMRKQQLGIDHPKTIEACRGLAVTYGLLGRDAEAEVLQLEVLRQRKQQLGIDHPRAIRASTDLAVTYSRLGRHAEAELLQVEALRRLKQQLGVDHPDSINVSINLAVTYSRLGRLADAEVLNLEALRQLQHQLGTDHPDTIGASVSLAMIYSKLERHAEAEALQVEVLRQRKQHLGTNHPRTISASCRLASTYYLLGRHAKAEVLQLEVLRQQKQWLGIDHLHTIGASMELAMTYSQLGRHAEAELLQVEALRRLKLQLGVDHPGTLTASNNLAFYYYSQGRYAEAKALQMEVVRLGKLILGLQHPYTLKYMTFLAAIEEKSKPWLYDRILRRLFS